MRKFTIEELSNLDLSSVKVEELPRFMDALMTNDSGIAAMCTVLLRTAGILELMPMESLDKLIKKCEEKDERGDEEEFRDGVITVLKVIREIKPKLDVVKPIREFLDIKESMRNFLSERRDF